MADGFLMTGGNNMSQQFFDPKLAQQLLQSLSGQQKQFQQFTQNPTASPLFQNQLQGLLAALAPSEAQAQTNLSDQFRGAGNMSSGAYGMAGANLQGDLMRNRQTLASDLLGRSFGQMSQALLGQMGLTPQLLNALKLAQSSGTSGGGSSRGGGAMGSSMPLTDNLPAGMTSGAYTQSLLNPASRGSTGNVTGASAPTDWGAYYDQLLGVTAGDRQNQQLAQSGATMFMPGGQYVSGGNAQGGAPTWSPPDPVQEFQGEWY